MCFSQPEPIYVPTPIRTASIPQNVKDNKDEEARKKKRKDLSQAVSGFSNIKTNPLGVSNQSSNVGKSTLG